MSLNLRNEVVMEVEQLEKSFRAHFPGGSTYQECFDALRQFAEKIMEMSKANEAVQTEQPSESSPQETPTA